MSAYIDTRCEKCNTRIGYMDTEGVPPCPKCGHVNKPIDTKALEDQLLREAGLEPDE